MTQTDNLPKPKHGLFEFLIGGLFFVGFPAFMTGMAPVSWLSFQRTDGRVAVNVQTCLFFAIPYRVRDLPEVTRVDTTFHQGDQLRDDRGRHQQGRAEDEGGLVLHGPQEGQDIAVSVSPASLKSVEARVKAFLDDPQQTSLSVFTIANWKFGLIFALPLCLLTVVYVVGWSIWLGQTLARPFQFARRDDETSEPDTEPSVQ